MSVPEFPDLAADRAFTAGTDLPGPDRMMELSRDAANQVRKWLGMNGINPDLLERHRFESLILPYLFEARRIGDQRGQFRERTPWAAFYPGTE